MAENDDNKIDDDESRLTPRQGLARIAPISVVEISCRDVPLGTALTLALNRYLESSNRFCVRTTVVDMMKPYICSSGVHGNDKGSKVPSFVCRICASLLRVVFSDKAECSQASIQVQIAACKPWWNTRCLEPVVVRSTRRRPRLGRKLLVGRDSQFASTPKQHRDLHDNNHAWKAYSRQLD
mgnify:FL=1